MCTLGAFFQAGTWVSFTVAEARRVHSSIMAVFRGLLGVNRPKARHMTDQQVVDELEIETPLNMIVAARIATFVRLILKTPGDLLSVMANAYRPPSNDSVDNRNKSWLSTVESHLFQLAEHSDLFEELKGADLRQWVRVVNSSGKRFNAVVLKALRKPPFTQVGFWWPKTSRNGRERPEDEMGLISHSCAMCDYSTDSIQALSWHEYTSHGLRHPMRDHIDGTVCIACLSDFHTRERVITHVTASSPRCRDVYLLVRPEVEPDKIVQLEVEAYQNTIKLLRSGRRRTFADIPPVRVDGPLLQCAAEAGILHKNRPGATYCCPCA